MNNMKYDSNINVDEQLNNQFYTLFVKKEEVAEIPSASLYEKMVDLKISSFINELSNSVDHSQGMNLQQIEIISRNTIYREKIKYYLDKAIPGKHFTYTNPSNTKTLVFRIIEHMDYVTKSFMYRVQSLEYAEEYTEDHKLKQIFFVDEPKTEETFVILSFNSEKQDIYINMGILSKNSLRYTKKPVLSHYQRNDIMTHDPVTNSSTHEYSIESLKGNTNRYTERWYDADISGRVVIIDPETCEIVKREVYYDTELEEWKARFKLMPYKSYFAVDIADKQADGTGVFLRPLTPLQQGKNYRFGTFLFPVDYMEAIRYLEQDNSPEADYHIAGIFFADNEFHDETIGLEYLKKSAAGGWGAAQVDLAVWYYFNDPQNLLKAADLIKSAIETEYAPAQFVAAYAYENGIIVDKSLESAFELYLIAAKNDYAPAILRLSQEDEDIHGEDNIRSAFLASAEKDNFYKQYCLGRALLGKTYMEEWINKYYWFDDNQCLGINSDHGYELILSAAKHNCANAIFDLACFFDFGENDFSPDKAQALKWYRKIAVDSDLIVLRITDWLLDGIGCESGYESDNEAYNLLFNLIEDGKGPQRAMYNLGWMHFFGRGCDVNYELAKKFFESAKTGSSYYYLGKIYEDGLIGNVNMNLAIEYYEKGADLKNENCIQRLNEWKRSKGKNDIPNPSSEEKIDLIYSTVVETNEHTKQILDNLSSLHKFIEDDLPDALRKAKKQIRVDTTAMGADLLSDEMVSTFIERMSEYINENTKSFEILIAEETNHLSSLFGQAWDKLLPTSRTALISAGVLWKSCAKIKDEKEFDFSGICISATSALENELKRYFYVGFQRYLEKNYGSPSNEKWEETFRNWPEVVLSTTKYKYIQALKNPSKYKKPILDVGKNFTLGSLPFLLGVWRGRNVSHDQFSLLLDRMDEYLQTIVKDSYQQNARIAFIGNGMDDSFVNKCERIRREYRNKAAHIDVVTRRQAEGCYHAVIGKIDVYNYTAKGTGALLELFSILK